MSLPDVFWYPLLAYKVLCQSYYYWWCLNSKRFALRLFRRYLPDGFVSNVKGKVLFDYGCGNGRIMMMATNLGMRCYGIDKVRCKYHRELRGNGVGLVIGGLDTFLAVSLNDVDLFTFIQVYEFMPDANRDDVFRKASEIMSPGGYLLFQTVNPRNAFTTMTGEKLSLIHTFFPYPALEHFYGIFRECGFEVVRESYEGFRYPFWSSFLLKFLPYMNTLCYDLPWLWRLLPPEKRGFVTFLLRVEEGGARCLGTDWGYPIRISTLGNLHRAGAENEL